MAAPMALAPGRGLGRIVLGLPLPAVVAYLRRHSSSLGNYDISYDDSPPFIHDIALDLPRIGLALRFDPLSQRLWSIELYDLERLSLAYNNSIINSPTVIPTFVNIYKLFGPTFPGDYEPKKHKYTLKYPGITFIFPIPQSFTPLSNPTDLPIVFPDGSTPVVSRIFVHSGLSRVDSSVVPKIGPDDLYFETVIVKPGHGIELTGRGSHVDLNATCQDVLAVLGRPEDVVTKSHSNPNIHRSSSGLKHQDDGDTQSAHPAYPDYIWNYFSMGIDAVFDGTQHRLHKIVLHSNVLAHHNANVYARCNFSVVCPDTDTKCDSDDDEVKHVSRSITVNTKWDDVQQLFGAPLGPPVVVNPLANQNPFGSTCYYAYHGILFEIIKNGTIASITIV